ncbi:MAG: tRNA (adenosine(37)-N6)-dimethylallyltransferase MiaA [Spirochaetia bacterium]
MTGTRTPDSAPPLIVVFGPTAVGKSELLPALFDSRFEIINADSMQVYRHMDVGTAKPDPALLSALPHHMIDVAEPSEQFNAGRFVKEAEVLAAQIRGRGRVPVICGGTAFYITSFLYGMPESPPANPKERERLRALERQEGSAALYAMLQARDPQGAARIEPADSSRVMRALEVVEASGRSLFSFPWPRTPRGAYRFLLIALTRERAELYRRIDARVQAMFSAGLLEEVKALLDRGYGPGDPGMRGIGYKEILAMRAGCETLSDVRGLIARNSRRYAKRQLTFFHAVNDVSWMDAGCPDAVRAKVESFVAATNPPSVAST